MLCRVDGGRQPGDRRSYSAAAAAPSNPLRGDDDFNIRRPDEVLKASIEASKTLELLLIVLASIALVIGGIGIMNVMLASVTQRTNEIEVRMAVGATATAIQIKFLGEAVLLSLFGGALGVPAQSGRIVSDLRAARLADQHFLEGRRARRGLLGWRRGVRRGLPCMASVPALPGCSAAQ